LSLSKIDGIAKSGNTASFFGKVAQARRGIGNPTDRCVVWAAYMKYTCCVVIGLSAKTVCLILVGGTVVIVCGPRNLWAIHQHSNWNNYLLFLRMRLFVLVIIYRECGLPMLLPLCYFFQGKELYFIKNYVRTASLFWSSHSVINDESKHSAPNEFLGWKTSFWAELTVRRLSEMLCIRLFWFSLCCKEHGTEESGRMDLVLVSDRKIWCIFICYGKDFKRYCKCNLRIRTVIGRIFGLQIGKSSKTNHRISFYLWKLIVVFNSFIPSLYYCLKIA